MYPIKLSLDKFDILLRSINQAQIRLQGIEQRQALLPMKYCARLAWEALYEARQILKIPPSQTLNKDHARYQRSHEAATSEITQIRVTLGQIMTTLQAIETNNDMSVMQAAAQSCLRRLNAISQRLSELASTRFTIGEVN